MAPRGSVKKASVTAGAESEDGSSPLAVSYVSLKSLAPYARNSRTHSRSNIQKLKASLMEYGWATPMGVADGTLIYGHGRLAAALELADEGVAIPHNPDQSKGPTVDLSHLNDLQRQAYVIQDNRSALDSGWDEDLLRLELGDLKSKGFDLSLTSFELPELTALFAGPSPTPADGDATEASPADTGGYKEQYGVIVVCTGEDHQQQVYEKLRDMGMDVRVVAT